jgi:hypothetical protein
MGPTTKQLTNRTTKVKCDQQTTVVQHLSTYGSPPIKPPHARKVNMMTKKKEKDEKKKKHKHKTKR